MILIAEQSYVGTKDAAATLGCRQETVFRLIHRGVLPGVMVAYRWLIPLDELDEFAKTYVSKKGRPRTKRKYTKRSPKWNRN